MLKSLTTKVHDVLVDCAKEGRVICTTELANRVGMSGTPFTQLKALTPTLEEVFHICVKHKLPPLFAIVHAPKGRHGTQIMAFWRLYKHGVYVLRTPAFRAGVLETLQQEVFTHYSQDTNMIDSFERDCVDNDIVMHAVTWEAINRLKRLHGLKQFSGLETEEKLAIMRFTCNEERLVNFMRAVQDNSHYKLEERHIRGIRSVMSQLSLT